MDHLTPQQIAAWVADSMRSPPLLLDVREPWEFKIAHIAGAVLMPMSTVPSHIAEIKAMRKDADVSEETAQTIICICHHGARSMEVAKYLEMQGIENVVNMTGGIHRWSTEVDPAVPTY